MLMANDKWQMLLNFACFIYKPCSDFFKIKQNLFREKFSVKASFIPLTEGTVSPREFLVFFSFWGTWRGLSIFQFPFLQSLPKLHFLQNSISLSRVSECILKTSYFSQQCSILLSSLIIIITIIIIHSYTTSKFTFLFHLINYTE